MGEDRLVVIREVPQLITNIITVLIREYATAAGDQEGSKQLSAAAQGEIGLNRRV